MGYPLNETGAAIVQDIYQLAFYRQLMDNGASSTDVRSPDAWHVSDETLAALLQEYAEVLRRTHHEIDAATLDTFASQLAPAPPPRRRRK